MAKWHGNTQDASLWRDSSLCRCFKRETSIMVSLFRDIHFLSYFFHKNCADFFGYFNPNPFFLCLGSTLLYELNMTFLPYSTPSTEVDFSCLVKFGLPFLCFSYYCELSYYRYSSLRLLLLFITSI